MHINTCKYVFICDFLQHNSVLSYVLWLCGRWICRCYFYSCPLWLFPATGLRLSFTIHIYHSQSSPSEILRLTMLTRRHNGPPVASTHKNARGSKRAKTTKVLNASAAHPCVVRIWFLSVYLELPMQNLQRSDRARTPMLLITYNGDS